MLEGKRVRIGDVAHLRGGYAFKSTQYRKSGRFVLRTINIQDDNSITKEGSTYISEEEAMNFERFSLEEFDTLFVMVAATLGKIGYVRAGDLPALLNQNMWVIRAKDDLIDRVYLHYLFRELSKIPLAWVGGSARSFLRRDDVRNLEFDLPDRETQERIAETLRAFDDKIDLNRRMNETLEAMARAIFKDWFVDFGPTRAKMEGRAPYLVPEIWALFPDRLDDEGKPEGWANSTIGEEVDVVGGSTPSTKVPEYWGGDLAWATPKDLSKLTSPVLRRTERSITEAGLTQIGSGLLPTDTVLLSSRAPIGYLAITRIPTAINQGFIAMLCRRRLSSVFAWLWTQANMIKILKNANGSTFQEISKANFRPIWLTVPSSETLVEFDRLVQPMFDKIVSNESEAQSLAATRDLLLPKLMSGEIRVKDAEKHAEAAA